MIHEVDQAICQLLAKNLIYPGSVLTDPSHIGIGFPEDDPEGPVVYLILHDIKENTVLRDETFHLEKNTRDGTARKRRARIWMNLGYLVVADGGKPAERHRLLADVARAFFVNEVMPAECLRGSNELEVELGVRISVAQDDLESHRKIESIWRAYDRPMKPCIAAVVTAAFNPYSFLPDVPLVREVFSVLRQVGKEGTDASSGVVVGDLRGSVLGYITEADGRSLVSGAVVRATGGDLSAISDSEGTFSFLDLPEGDHSFEVTHEGMKTAQFAINVPPKGRAFELAPVHITLVPTTGVVQSGWSSGNGRDVPCKIVSGVVRYPDGAPAAFIPLRAGNRRGATNSHGSYAMVINARESALWAEIPGLGEVAVSDEGIVVRPPLQKDEDVP